MLIKMLPDHAKQFVELYRADDHSLVTVLNLIRATITTYFNS